MDEPGQTGNSSIKSAKNKDEPVEFSGSSINIAKIVDESRDMGRYTLNRKCMMSPSWTT